MALNFHAAEIEASTPARTEYIISRVREYLVDVQWVNWTRWNGHM